MELMRRAQVCQRPPIQNSLDLQNLFSLGLVTSKKCRGSKISVAESGEMPVNSLGSTPIYMNGYAFDVDYLANYIGIGVKACLPI